MCSLQLDGPKRYSWYGGSMICFGERASRRGCEKVSEEALHVQLTISADR